jgi:hypothetical protein
MHAKDTTFKMAFCIALLLIVLPGALHAEDMRAFELEDLVVAFDPPLQGAAKEVQTLFPKIKRNLEGLFGWQLNLRPTVLITKNSKYFGHREEKPLLVAYAVPRKNLIVIDYSRVKIRPFSLENTLKHEVCHLLLHHHIERSRLPKWLDEGVCQWVSDGISEFFFDQKQSQLNRASFSRNFIPLRSLEYAFPSDKESLLLAYEESKSFVNYLISRYGKEILFEILNDVKGGMEADEAILQAVSMSRESLEVAWRKSLTEKISWLAHISYHLYGILFGLMGLIALYAFVKQIRKKRAYTDEEEVDDIT